VAIQRFLIARPGRFPRPTDADLTLAPYEKLGNAAVATGFIDYLPYEDGTVRSVPLFVEAEGRMVPQMGLTLACMMTGADLTKVSYDNGSVVIPRTGGQPPIRIPVRTYYSRKLGRDIPLMMDIPWFGGDKWERMYDTLGQAPRQHMSMARVWGLIHTRRQILRNNQQADLALGELWKLFDPDQYQKYAKQRLPDDDWTGRLALIGSVLDNKDDFTKAAIDLARQSPEAKRTPEEVHAIDAANALEQIRTQNPSLQRQLVEGRRQLASDIQGKAVMIGHIATGLVRDKVPTSLHAECPGVVVHGVIYNGIVTGELWRFLPRWVTVAWTITLGLLTTFTTARLPPARALLTALLLIAGFVTVNFILLFDYGNVILGVAGPVVAIGTVWGGCTLARLVIERRERTLITQRFRNYVDPKLVDYVTAHPDQVKFEGQTRDMTVVFTDLGNFTPLTARLGEKTVPLLNEFLGRMVPVIRKHNGYVNKFLGDGIMFFYNAPEQNPHHARDAIATVLEMQEVLAGFNRDLADQGLPAVTLRAGVSTGNMIVGDAGTAEASDYTVLGDTVNYGSRLEGANKPFGSASLITERTVRQGGDGFLLRPMGKPAVVGRQEQQADLCYEVLARLDQATDEQRQLAQFSTDVVEAYVAGRFPDCLGAIDRMEAAVGAAKFTRLYRDECLRMMMDGVPANFHGQIVLTEK
jgi:class 3 adenylate cyclase